MEGTKWAVRGNCDVPPSGYGGLPEIEAINASKIVRFRPDGGILANMLYKWQNLRAGYCSLSLLSTADELAMLSQGPRILMLIPHSLCFNADIAASVNWYWPPHTTNTWRVG